VNLPSLVPYLRRFATLLREEWFGTSRTLKRLLRQNRYSLTYDGAQFGGLGWDKLGQALQVSRFVLVGENHGLAQVPAFTQALAQRFAPQVYVAELDAYQARDLAELVAQPGPPTAYLRQHPGGLAFYSWVEEFELVRELQAQQVELWGIDQIFLASTGRFYARLAEQARKPVAQAYLQHWAAAYQAQDWAALQAGTEAFSIFSQPRSAVEELLALVQAESPVVQAMAHDYAYSHLLYQQQLAGTGGHQQRVNLLKRNLLQYLLRYQAARGPAWPRMLLKFGAVHLARNLSPLLTGGYYDLGSLVQHLADVQDEQSLHVFVIGKQGHQAVGAHPDDPTRNSTSYGTDEFPFLRAFFRLTGTTWEVFDLRPVREVFLSGKLRLPNQNLLRIVLGYDFLVVIPETTASQGY